jgi:PLD-like domain
MPAARRSMPRLRTIVLPLFGAWAATAAWNGLKPLPAGTRVTSLPARIAESQVTIIRGGASEILAHELAAIDRADEVIIIDETPLPRELGQRLLQERHQRPNLKVVLVSDPRSEAHGGTPAEYLESLERAGVIVARVRLDRLRDSTPLYSGLWRLALGWWSNPYDESPLRAALRARNGKADERSLLVSDDGAGGWTSIVAASGTGDLALEVAGGLAHEVAASELEVAEWSSADDRLPAAPRPEGRGVGSVDARYLTEGAIRAALLEGLAAAGDGDRVSLSARALSDRRLIDALLRAAARGARLQVLLDPAAVPNAVVAAELAREGGGRIEVRWAPRASPALLIVRHRGDLWASVGGADFTRPSLGDFNLEAAVELRLPAIAGAARVLDEWFAAAWTAGAPDGRGRLAEGSRTAYWRYRLVQAAALAPY